MITAQSTLKTLYHSLHADTIGNGTVLCCAVHLKTALHSQTVNGPTKLCKQCFNIRRDGVLHYVVWPYTYT